MNIITALVIILAFLIAGAISYTAVDQVYNKATEKGTSLINFNSILNFFTGKKAFTISVSPETYSLKNIAVLDSEGKTVREVNAKSIDVSLKPEKKYSVKMLFEDILEKEIEVQSKEFNPKKDLGKTLDFLGHINGKSFVFMKGKITPYGITGQDGRALKPKENYALTTKPIEIQKEVCSDKPNTAIANTEITLKCPEWDSNGVGKCILGPIHAGACFGPPITAWKAIGVKIDTIPFCGQEKFESDDPNLPDFMSSLKCPSGQIILYASTDNEKYTLSQNEEKTVPVKIYSFSEYSVGVGNLDLACAGSGSHEESCKRGPCKFVIYYKKFCPPGYYYDRSISSGRCAELESV